MRSLTCSLALVAVITLDWMASGVLSLASGEHTEQARERETKEYTRFKRASGAKRQFYRFGRALADDPESLDKRQFYRFGRDIGGDSGDLDKRQFRLGRSSPDFTQLNDDPETLDKRQFYRFGRDIHGDFDDLDKRQLRVGRSNPDSYTDKRFLRFGRSAPNNEMDSSVALRDLLNDRDDEEAPGSRKRRSLAGDQSQHDLLKRSRRSAEAEGDDRSSEHKQLAKRDVADTLDMATGGQHDVERRSSPPTKLMKFGKRFMRFGRNIEDFDDLAAKRFMRFGKRGGELPEKRFMRFGRRSFDDFADKRFIRFGKRAGDDSEDIPDKRFMRFGRDFLKNSLKDFADKRFMRFGKRFDALADKRFMRFGRSTTTREEADHHDTLSSQKS